MNPSRFQVTSTLMNNRPLSVFYIYQLSHTPVRLNCSRIYERATSTDFSKHQPCLCLCFGFSQIIRMLPFLLITLHFSHIGFTDDLTFTANPPFLLPVQRGVCRVHRRSFSLSAKYGYVPPRIFSLPKQGYISCFTGIFYALGNKFPTKTEKA